MWLVGQAGTYDRKTGWVKMDLRITAKDLICAIKLKGQCSQSDLIQLSTGLNELALDGVIRFELKRRNVKRNKERINPTCEIKFLGHRLGDKNLNHEVSDDVVVLAVTPSSPGSDGPAAKIFKSLKLPRGRRHGISSDSLSQWDKENGATIQSIMDLLTAETGGVATPESLIKARRSLKGLTSPQRYNLETVMRRHLSGDELELFLRIIAVDPRKTKTKQGPVETIVRQMQTLTQAGSADNWLDNNEAKLQTLIKMMKASQDAQDEFTNLGKQMVQGRVFNPLKKAGRSEQLSVLQLLYLR